MLVVTRTVLVWDATADLCERSIHVPFQQARQEPLGLSGGPLEGRTQNYYSGTSRGFLF